MHPFLALITPLSQPAQPPPGIWPDPGYPAHPIAPGGPPPGVWPPGSGINLPTHPIEPGGKPPEIWPGPGPLPGVEHPIVLPPGQPVPTSFTVVVRNDATGEWKAMKFVPGEATPPTHGPGPKA